MVDILAHFTSECYKFVSMKNVLFGGKKRKDEYDWILLLQAFADFFTNMYGENSFFYSSRTPLRVTLLHNVVDIQIFTKYCMILCG